MKNMKLRGFSKRCRCVTTQRSASIPVFEDLVKRRFHAQAPNQVYVGDILPICPVGTALLCIWPRLLICACANLPVL